MDRMSTAMITLLSLSMFHSTAFEEEKPASMWISFGLDSYNESRVFIATHIPPELMLALNEQEAPLQQSKYGASLPLMLVNSQPFVSIQTEKYFTENISGALKAKMHNQRVAFSQQFNHSMKLEGVGKYHMESSFLTLGFGIHQDRMTYNNYQGMINIDERLIQPSLILGAGISLTDSSRIELSSSFSSPVKRDIHIEAPSNAEPLISVMPKHYFTQGLELSFAYSYNLNSLNT